MEVDIELRGFLCRCLRCRFLPHVHLVGLLWHVVCDGAPCAFTAAASIYQICKNGEKLQVLCIDWESPIPVGKTCLAAYGNGSIASREPREFGALPGKM